MKKELIKIAMTTAAAKALDYKNINIQADVEEVIKHVMYHLDSKGESKVCAIAAASLALKYKQEFLSDKQIMQRIMNESEEVLASVCPDVN